MANKDLRLGKAGVRWMALAVSAGVITVNASASYAIFGIGTSVVFDPQNYTQNVRQLAEIVQQVQRVQEQVQNDLRALRRLGMSGADGLLRSVTDVQGSMGEGYGGDTARDLERQYPTEYRQLPSLATVPEERAEWELAKREALEDARATQDAVVADMPRVSERVAEVVAASNAADGVTAAEQARNLLLAEANGEASKLLAVRASRERARVEQGARDQSEQAYARARREHVMSDWTAGEATSPVANPFGR